MTEKNIKLIALDMDGTLLTSENEITEKTHLVIRKALEQHVDVILSTGRWLGSCYPFAEALNLKTYIITSNGGEIWTMDKQLLERHLLEAGLVKKMWKLASNLGMNTWMVTTERVYRNGERPGDFFAHEWLKFGCDSLDQHKLDTVVEELSYYQELELTNSLPTNIEVNPSGVHKASALESVCREKGITMAEVMAVGDSLNDIKMIQQAGLGVAMGNAQEAIKNVADYITDSNDCDGVRKAIEKFVLK
jgi:hydroxymethylpyrimidine pyrophosphatase-like HAD family hydrolase